MVKKYLSDQFLQQLIWWMFHPEHNERVVNLNNAQGLNNDKQLKPHI